MVSAMFRQTVKEMKEFTTRVYESSLIDDVLGDTFRPGGIELTARLAEVAGLCDDYLVLEIACGKGATSSFLSQEYGCRVVGIDLSAQLVSLARKRVEVENLSNKVDFLLGDGEELPFKDSTFDVVMSECSFSLLPNKDAASIEIERVTKPGGRLVISDVTVRGQISERLKNQVTFSSCISGAESIDGYIKLFEKVGFIDAHVEDHSEEMKRLAYQILVSFGSFEMFERQVNEASGQPSRGCCEGKCGDVWQGLFKEAKVGYALVSFVKPG